MDKVKETLNKVPLSGYIVLVIAIAIFSGLFANAGHGLNIFDFDTLNGKFGTMKSAKATFSGQGGSGARDGFLFAFGFQNLGKNNANDVFCKLVPFWQLELYFGKVLGRTPLQQADKGGFYPEVYEYARNKDYTRMTHGEIQLDFVYACSKISGMLEPWLPL